MRSLAAVFALFAAGAGAVCAPSAEAQAQGQTTPVVVEFFTSQGCSACPPADALFGELARRPGVIALALHVDYWDYLGWKDAFALPENTARQRAYAKAHRSRTIYTPQIIVQGADMIVGHETDTILDRIEAHRRAPMPVTLEVARRGGVVEIALAPSARPVGAAEVHVVRFIPSHTMTIGGGENAGIRHDYVNVVSEWRTIGRWDGSTDAEMAHEAGGGDPLAVIVQAVRNGPVLAAAALP
ncbi:DUF1223 domain-containing protein [soil metagenome]